MRAWLIGSLVLAGAPAAAQQRPAPPPPADDSGDETEVTVQASRNLPGSVTGDIPPDQTLGPAEIRSYGVSSVSDLLTELGPQLRSGRGGGPPVVLLDGRRIAGFQEIRDLPAEAILRVEILPEEVALKYGYSADQRVINFVLRPRFQAVTAELESRFATEGGRATPQGEVDVLKLNRRGRINLHAEYFESSALTEAERGVAFQPSSFAVGGNVTGAGGGEIDPVLSARVGAPVIVAGVPAGATRPTLADFAATANNANVSDPRPFRTLLPAQRSLSINGIYAFTLPGNIAATLNGRLDASDSRGLLGPAATALSLPAGNPFSPFSRAVLVNRALDSFGPLRQDSTTLVGHAGATFNGNVGKWQWSVLGNFDRVTGETFTETGVDASRFQARLNANDPTANPFGPLPPGVIDPLAATRAFSSSTSGGVDALANGSLFALPAGKVAVSLKVAGQTLAFDSRAVRGGVFQSVSLGRTTTTGQFNLDVPIASRSRKFLGEIGNLSANFNLAFNDLSDFGTLRTIGYGFNWAPVEAFRLIGSVTEQDNAPSIQQIGNPVITTVNVRVFDFVTGRNATVTSISGGNPALTGSNRLVNQLKFTLKPLAKTDFNITGGYSEARVDNPVANFPTTTAAIAAAFPGRFTRDAGGDLIAIDTRPVNFARTSSSEFRYGFDLTLSIKSTLQKQIEAFRAGKGPNPFIGLIPRNGRLPQSVFGGNIFGIPQNGQRPPVAGQAGGAAPQAGAPGAGPRPGVGPGGGGFGGGGRGGQAAAGGRLNFSIYHTVHLSNRVRVGVLGPELDLLGGDTISNGPGQPRHEVELQAGYTNNGLGVRLSGNWNSGSRVTAGLAGTAQALDFGSLATLNIRLFADLTQRLDLLKKYPWVRGVRVVLAVDNIFNARQRVTDPAGVTPIAYQGAYLDPLGRSVRLSIRKLFL